MTGKELKRLSRADLLEMLIDQSKEFQRLQKRLKAAEAALEKREIAIDEAGSLAEAALSVNGVFEAAQAACEQYMENIRLLSNRQEEICRRREEESAAAAGQMLEDARGQCEAMKRAAAEECAAMLLDARKQIESYWQEVIEKRKALERNGGGEGAGGEHEA